MKKYNNTNSYGGINMNEKRMQRTERRIKRIERKLKRGDNEIQRFN